VLLDAQLSQLPRAEDPKAGSSSVLAFRSLGIRV